MTFTEAAAEVLRLAGRALHYKKITELAIEKNLLSHVGKTPDVTMGSRLATLVKKDRGDAPIVRVKSGYFALREWGEAALAGVPEGGDEAGDVPAAADATAAEDTAPGTEAAPAAAPSKPEARRGREPRSPVAPAPAARAEGPGGERRGRRRRGRDRDRDRDRRPEDQPTAPAADMAVADDVVAANAVTSEIAVTHGDDAMTAAAVDENATTLHGYVRERRDTELAPAPSAEDVLSAEPDESMVTPVETRREAPAAETDVEGEDDEDDDDEPIFGTPASTEGRRRRRRRGRGRDGEPDRVDADRAGAGDRPERPEQRADGRDRGERVERGERNDREAPRRDDGTEMTGRELGDAIAGVLAGGDRSPLGLGRIAELLVRKGRLTGEPGQHHQSIAAVIRADIASHAARSRRHRFRVLPGGRFALTEWAYPVEAIRFEQEAVAAGERQRDSVYRAFFKRFAELPGPAAVELVSAWLGAMGVGGLRIIRRPGASGAELHLGGTLRRGVEETRLAVVVRRDSREIGRERVIEIRGALQHYGNASAAWLVTTGTVLSGAREEAATPAAPVALFDAIAFGRSLEDAGVGIRRAVVPLAVMDLDLLDTLRGPGDRPN